MVNYEAPPNPPEVAKRRPKHQGMSHLTRAEITNPMKNSNNGKAAGYDDIPPEAIKAGVKVSEEVLLDLCNWIWSRG